MLPLNVMGITFLLIPRGVYFPARLAFPVGPLGSCFGLVVICGCERVARLRLLTHSFESFQDSHSIFCC